RPVAEDPSRRVDGESLFAPANSRWIGNRQVQWCVSSGEIADRLPRPFRECVQRAQAFGYSADRGWNRTARGWILGLGGLPDRLLGAQAVMLRETRRGEGNLGVHQVRERPPLLPDDMLEERQGFVSHIGRQLLIPRGKPLAIGAKII